MGINTNDLILDIIKLLKPQNIFMTKKRLGNPLEDGGYVMVDYVLENCVALFAYGVSTDTTYEEDFSTKYNKPSYMFDHTVTLTPEEVMRLKNLGCIFFAEGLGFQEKCKDFHQHYKELNINGYVLLKIDIESDEYPFFLQTDIDKMKSNVMGIIIEFHWINIQQNQIDLIKILHKLGSDFILFHIHGNNWGGQLLFEEMQIPNVLELSFINRKFIGKYEPDNQYYPIKGLDVANRVIVPDYDLSFLNYKRK